MDPLKTYDYLTLARKQVFDWVRPLSAEQYGRVFPIGFGNLARTLTHVMICEWMYVRRLQDKQVPSYSEWPIQDENPPPFAGVESAWNEQAVQTRVILAAVEDWNKEVEYPKSSEGGQPEILIASVSDIFTQLAFHEIHHRAQAMNMLRHLGVAMSDIDYNALMYRSK